MIKTALLLVLLVVQVLPGTQAFGSLFGRNHPLFQDPFAPFAARPSRGHWGQPAQHQQQPCLNHLEPLERVRFESRADTATGSTLLTAHLRGVQQPTVTLARAGLLEVAAARHVPRHCAVYGATDRLVRQFQVPAGLAADDIRYEFDPRSETLVVEVPQAPRPAPAHCLSARAPLSALETSEELRPGGVAQITASMPGVQPRHTTVRVLSPGVLELTAARAVPQECRRYHPEPDTVRRLWRVHPRLANTNLRATLRDGALQIVFPAQVAPVPIDQEGRPLAARPTIQPEQQKQQHPPPPQAPQPPQPRRPYAGKSLKELEEMLASIAAEYVLAGQQSAAEQPEPVHYGGESLTDPDGAPRWFHTPLEGDSLESVASSQAVCDEDLVDLDDDAQPRRVTRVHVFAC